MKPEIPEGTTTRGWLMALGALAAAKAVGLIALMSAIAAALAHVAAGSAVDVRSLLLWGVSGAVLRAGATWATRVVAQRAALGVKEELRSQLIHRRVESGSTEREAEVSALASRGLDGLDPYFRDYLPALVSCAVIPLAVGARILFADWVSALILVLTIPLVPIFMILIGLHTAERVGQAQAGLDRLGRHLTELARGLPVLVGLRRATQQRLALAEVSERHRIATMGTLRTAFLSAFALELIATLSVAVVAVFIGVRLVYGNMTLEAGLLALLLAPDAFTPLRDLGSAHHASEDGVAALRRVRAELDSPSRLPLGSASGAERGLAISELVAERAGRENVGPVSFEASAGTITALMGPSGCGKSTVLEVLAGTLRASGLDHADPTAERILLRGQVSGVDPSRRSVVPQSPRFAAATALAEVALYVGADRTDELAALLPARQWDTPLERLSPGERRRVAVARGVGRARALCREGRPSLLLLDEPTAHLDSASARRVRALISLSAEEGVTVVVATHDPELAALAQQRVQWPSGAIGEPSKTAVPSVTSAAQAHAGAVGQVHPSAPGPAPSATELDAGPTAELLAEPQIESAATPGTARGAWRLLPVRSWRLWAAVGLGALSVLAAAALSGLSGWLIVQASQQPPMLHLMMAIVGVRACGLARAVLRYRERLATHDVVLRWAAGLRVKLWDSLGSDARGWSRLTRPGGALATLIAEVDELRDALPRVLVPIPAAVLAALASAITIAFVAPAALPIAVIVLLLGVVAVPLAVLAVERRAARHLADHRADVAERTGRVLAAAPDLCANDRAAEVSVDFARSDARATSDLRRDALGAGVGRASASLLSGVGAVIAIIAGAASTDPRLLALAALLLLAMDEPLGQLGDALRNVPVLGTMLSRVGPWVSDDARLAPLPATASERPSQATPVAESEESVRRVDGVRVSGLSAGYGDKAIFSGVSGEAVPGRVWAVTGPSGSGKSTLIATILGFLPARHGSVQLRVAEDAERWLPAAQAGVAWCPQDGYVFDSTLRGNLALARDRAHVPSEPEMEEALERVGLGRWYAHLPLGLDTLTGPGGERLSGGQRQRLAVARTLLSGAGVVVLDEPTAHLGQDEGHELVRDVLRGAGPTALVLVTHDPAVAATADRLTVLPGRP